MNESKGPVTKKTQATDLERLGRKSRVAALLERKCCFLFLSSLAMECELTRKAEVLIYRQVWRGPRKRNLD